MHEFETFVYLDVPKTGSTYIFSVLKKFCLEREVRTNIHMGIEDETTKDKLHFISIRDPVEQYISLYSFGCQASGNLFKRFHKRGLGDMYNGTWRGFRQWLDFVLDVENAHLLSDEYGARDFSRASSIIGLQSHRVLAMAMRNGYATLATCGSRSEVTSAYEAYGIVDFTVRNERLRIDLAELLGGKLKNSISDLPAALDYIASAESINASDRIDRYKENPKLGNRRRRRLEEREWPFYKFFGY